MGHFDYTIRNYRPEDFDGYVRLNSEAEALDDSGHVVSPELLRERLGRPGFSAEQDLFLAELDGQVVGYVEVTLELGVGRAVLDCLVHPEHRREGLARRLFGGAMRHAADSGVRAVHVGIAEGNAAATGLLCHLGFASVCLHVEMSLELAGAHLPACGPSNVQLRHLQFGEEDRLTEIQNRCFDGTWGFSPNTREEVAYRLNLRNAAPENVVLAMDRDTIIGYCWTTMCQAGDAGVGRLSGRVNMLGVAPEYRGRGIGRLLLVAGLAYLKRKGTDAVKLTVDDQNRAAIAIYESVGFKTTSKTLWYEKAIEQPV